MSQGSILKKKRKKKANYGKGISPIEDSVNHSGISNKHSQNQHNTIWRFNHKIYYEINNVIWGK